MDPTKGHIKDAAGNVWQVLNEDGEYDDVATAAAYDGGKGQPTYPKK